MAILLSNDAPDHAPRPLMLKPTRRDTVNTLPEMLMAKAMKEQQPTKEPENDE